MPDNQKQANRAKWYAEGQNAYCNGKSVQSCPYGTYLAASKYWILGFEDALKKDLES